MNRVKFLKETPMNVISGETYPLLESWGDYLSGEGSAINESVNSNIIQFPKSNYSYKDGEVYIDGIFMQADVVNGNRRVYPRRILDNAVNEYMENRVKKGKALGEWTHPPDRVEIDHTQAVLLIEDLWWEGSNVHGRAIITTGDYAGGDKIASLLRTGWKPSVSSRGLGKLVGNMKKDGYMTVDAYRIAVGIDIVNDPSAPDAHVNVIGFNENLQEKLTINNSMKEENKNVKSLIQNLRKYSKF